MTRAASLRRTLLIGILAPVALFIVINSVGLYRQSRFRGVPRKNM